MEIFYNGKRSGYDEIVSYGPRWWTEYREMNANYKYAGWTLDLMAYFLEQTVKNQFPSEADERTIVMLEKMLCIEYDGKLTLEDRRRIVSAYYSGAGHLSRSVIKSLAMAYTGSECEVWWLGTILQIRILCEDDSWFSNKNFYSILSRRMPAHIAFYLRNMLCTFVLVESVKYDRVKFRNVLSWWDGSFDGSRLLDGGWMLDNAYPPFFKTKHRWYSDSNFSSAFGKQKYAFVNEIEWMHEILEKFRMSFNWWGNSIDGGNNLDGGVLLDAVYAPFFVAKIPISVINDIEISHISQRFSYQSENVFRSRIYSVQRVLLNWWDELKTLDGVENLDGGSLLNQDTPPKWGKKICRMPMKIDESFSVTMFVPGNAKPLDGTAFLDGNIYLNSGRGGTVMAGTTVTTRAKKKMLEARAGIAPLPKIVGMVFGDGGVNASGEIVPHSAEQNSLHHEVLRKPIDGYEVVSDTKIRYSCTLATNELANTYISETGLYDADGDLVAMKAFMKKGKDGDMEVVFECEDSF